MVLGAGGTGGPIGAFLARAGRDVTLIARGRHLEAMRSGGLKIEFQDERETVPVKAASMEEYQGTPDEVEERAMPVLKKVEEDLKEAGIIPVLSPCIERDALQKFSFVSPMAAVGACFDVTAASMQRDIASGKPSVLEGLFYLVE